MTERQEDREPEADEAAARRQRSRRTVWVGAVVLAVCLLLALTPIVLGAKLGRFIFVLAFVGGCWGLSCIMHGGWDWWRGA